MMTENILFAHMFVCLFSSYNIASNKEMLAIMNRAAVQIESTDAVCSVLNKYLKDRPINQTFAEVIHCPAHIPPFLLQFLAS